MQRSLRCAAQGSQLHKPAFVLQFTRTAQAFLFQGLEIPWLKLRSALRHCRPIGPRP